jgi:hypothetical protein
MQLFTTASQIDIWRLVWPCATTHFGHKNPLFYINVLSLTDIYIGFFCNKFLIWPQRWIGQLLEETSPNASWFIICGNLFNFIICILMLNLFSCARAMMKIFFICEYLFCSFRSFGPMVQTRCVWSSLVYGCWLFFGFYRLINWLIVWIFFCLIVFLISSELILCKLKFDILSSVCEDFSAFPFSSKIILII